MSGVQIKLTVNDSELQKALQKLSQLGDDKTDLFHDIGEQLLNSTQDRFDNQEDPQGVSWEPLTAKTLARKRAKKKPTDILIEDSYLRDTLHFEAEPDQLLLGSNLIYAATHQLGDDSRGIPARPFLGLSDDEADIARIINDHVTQALT